MSVEVANQINYCELSPRVIVPMLADDGIYIASESTFYKILKEEKLLLHRGKQRPRSVEKPLAVIAVKPNTVWSWDITYLKSSVQGEYFYLYLVMDVYSRLIVGWKVHLDQNSDHSALLIDEC